MLGLARLRAESGADQGKNEKNWLGKARSIISNVFDRVMLRLTSNSSADGSKSAHVNAHGCIETTTDEKEKDDSERTRLDLGELIYGSGRGRTRCLGNSTRPFAYGTESVLPTPVSLKDVADSECRESSKRCGVKASPYGQMLLRKRHQRAILRLSTIIKKSPGMELLDAKVRKSNGKSVIIGSVKGCTGDPTQSTIRARAVAWVSTKLQCARQKMKVKTLRYKVSNPIKEEERNDEYDSKDGDVNILKNEGGEVELCKKRILLGKRCKPLNCSGSLHYDENGILLPESLP